MAKNKSRRGGRSRLSAMITLDPENAKREVRASALRHGGLRAAMAADFNCTTITLWRNMTTLGMLDEVNQIALEASAARRHERTAAP